MAFLLGKSLGRARNKTRRPGSAFEERPCLDGPYFRGYRHLPRPATPSRLGRDAVWWYRLPLCVGASLGNEEDGNDRGRPSLERVAWPGCAGGGAAPTLELGREDRPGQ